MSKEQGGDSPVDGALEGDRLLQASDLVPGGANVLKGVQGGQAMDRIQKTRLPAQTPSGFQRPALWGGLLAPYTCKQAGLQEQLP